MRDDREYLYKDLAKNPNIENIEIPNCILNGIAEKYALREYQKNALKNFICYFENKSFYQKNIVDENHYNKFVIISIIISIVLIFFIFVVVVGNLGIYLASSYQYPEYIVLKRISLFNFLDRIENMVVIQWIFALCLSICIVVYYISKTIKKKKNNKLINTGIILALLIVSLYHCFFSLCLFET